MGWLDSTPKSKNNDRKSRRKELHKDDPNRKLPDCGSTKYLADYFTLSGMCESNGYGAVPLSWQEIVNFDIGAGLNMSAWERRTIRTMSQIYCNVVHESPNRSPYVRDFTPEEWETFGKIQLQAMEESEKKASEL